MDASFQFPRHTAPIPRTAPRVTTPSSSTNRGSNALRASVLDAALELGIGQNSTVMNWMFNNSLTEEDEEVCTLSFFCRFFFLHRPTQRVGDKRTVGVSLESLFVLVK